MEASNVRARHDEAELNQRPNLTVGKGVEPLEKGARRCHVRAVLIVGDELPHAPRARGRAEDDQNGPCRGGCRCASCRQEPSCPTAVSAETLTQHLEDLRGGRTDPIGGERSQSARCAARRRGGTTRSDRSRLQAPRKAGTGRRSPCWATSTTASARSVIR